MSMSTMFQSKTVAIVTGASKGLGRAVACAVASELSQTDSGQGSYLILVSRSKEGLEETRNAIESGCSSLRVRLIPGDLGDLKNLAELTSLILNCIDSSQFSCALLVNNAASLGMLKAIRNHDNVERTQKYMDLNVTSPMYLVSRFIDRFSNLKRYVVNISSILAVQSSPSLSLYCTGKAARDMFHQVLAEESKDIRVLNYAPGPLKTEMFEDIKKNSDSDEVRTLFADMTTKGVVLDTETSAGKLMVLLKEDRYKSGAHIDYFDELP